MVRVYISILVATLAMALNAERYGFERYQSVIERQMFGPLPAGFDPTKPASEVSKSASKVELTKEQEQVRSAIHFSMINVTPTGDTAVGFSDVSDPKTPKNYYIKVGEKSGPWEVKEADAVNATMTIYNSVSDVEVSLKLGDNTGGGAAKAGGGMNNSPAAGGGRGLTLRGRRQLRDQERRSQEEAAAAAEEKRRAEAAAAEEERRRKDEEERAKNEAIRVETQKQLQQVANELKEMKIRDAQRSQDEDSGGDSADGGSSGDSAETE